jgi:hypothetical protein
MSKRYRYIICKITADIIKDTTDSKGDYLIFSNVQKTGIKYFLRCIRSRYTREEKEENIMCLDGMIARDPSTEFSELDGLFKEIKRKGKIIHIDQKLHDLFQSPDQAVALMAYKWIVDDYEKKISNNK